MNISTCKYIYFIIFSLTTIGNAKRTEFTYYKSELKDAYIIINTDFIIMGIFFQKLLIAF